LLVDAQGRYHIPEYPRRELQELFSVDTLIKHSAKERHFIANLDVAAARSFAPLLAPPEYPAILNCEGLLSVNALETNYHCTRARQLRPKSSTDEAPEDWLKKLLVRFLFPHAGRARFLMKMNLWAEARKDQEEWLQNLNVKINHPRWLADLAETYFGQLVNDRTPSTDRNSLLNKAIGHFEEALSLFSNPGITLHDQEKKFEQAYIETRYANLLLTECSDDNKRVKKALAYVDGVLKAPDLPSKADSFERAGDVVLWKSISNNQKAAEYYDAVIARQPKYVQPILKRATLWLEANSSDEAKRLLSILDKKLWRAAIHDAELRLKHKLPSPPVDFALRNYQIPAIKYALENNLINDSEASGGAANLKCERITR
jgi:hypothetical protein